MDAFIFFLLALISEVVGTIGGFGSSVFFVPLASLFFEFHIVLALTGILHIFSNSAKLILFRKGFHGKTILRIGLPSVLMVLVGALLSAYIEIKYITLFMGVFLIAFSLFFQIKPDVKINPTVPNSVIGGGLAGFLAGLIGTGGAIRGLLLSALQLEKNAFIATSAAIDFGVDFTRSIVYLAQGYMDWSLAWYIPILLVIAFAGSWLGKMVVQRISEAIFKRIILAFITVIGVLTVVQFFIPTLKL